MLNMSQRSMARMTALLFLCSLACSLRADSESAKENQIRVAIFCHFLDFVKWPEEALPEKNQAFVIGVSGPPEVLTLFRSIGKSHTVHGHKVTVIELSDSPTKESLATCHALFFATDNDKVQDAYRSVWSKRAILTCGNGKAFVEKGGILGLVRVGSKVKFEINTVAAKACGLRVPAKLLRLAERVIEEE